MSNILDSSGAYITKNNPIHTTDVASNTWAMHDSKTDNTAVTTKGSEPEKSHYVTNILVSYGDGSATGSLVIKDGSTILIDQGIAGQEIIPFSKPLKITEGNSLTVELSSGGLGVVNKLNVVGFTE